MIEITRSVYAVVAFTLSTIIGIIGLAVVVWYGKTRRAPGASLTWGQAMAAAAYTFFLMFWWYGIIPHLWLSWADNELNWRPDRTLWAVGNVLRPEAAAAVVPTSSYGRPLVRKG